MGEGFRGTITTIAVLVALFGTLVVPASAQVGPLCDGRPVTIEGTSGPDDLVGTPGDDVILARAGSDRIWGGGGDDVICAGEGDDRVFAGAGDDRVFGNGGRDKIRGGPGHDALFGGNDLDYLKGGANDDHLDGQDGPDRIRGGSGRDTLLGGQGDDLLWGGPGDDLIEGGRNADTVKGGDGQADRCVFLASQSPRYTDRHDASCEQISFPSPYPAQLDCVAWPTERWPTGETPPGVRAAKLEIEVDRVVHGGSESVVVIHGGRIVSERYAAGDDATTLQPSYSLSKPFAATVIGLLVQDGHLVLDAPAPVPEWSNPADPRHAITLRHLLNMASGLQWTERHDGDPNGDMLQMLRTVDSASFPASKPLDFAPGQRWEYSTGTTQILSRIISQTVDLYGDDLKAELATRLFDRLGQQPVLLLDQSGVWLGGLVTNMTTREFAKLGLLYLRGGIWEDTQLLDSEWIDYVRAGGLNQYAGQWWGPGDGLRISAAGIGGQVLHVLSDLDLVIAANSNTGSAGGNVQPIIDLFETAEPATCPS